MRAYNSVEDRNTCERIKRKPKRDMRGTTV